MEKKNLNHKPENWLIFFFLKHDINFCSNRPALGQMHLQCPKIAQLSIETFTLKIHMLYDPSNWWIKHTVYIFKRTNNTEKC